MPLDNEIFGDVTPAQSTDSDIFKDVGGQQSPAKTATVSTPVPSLEGKGKSKVDIATPSDMRVALNAISKGIALTPDMFLNAPTNALNLAKALGGTWATAAGRPDLAPEITQPPNYANRLFTAVGAIGPAGEPQNDRQKIIDAIGQGAGGMMLNPASTVPQLLSSMGIGAASGLASEGTRQLTGNDTAGDAVGMLTPLAITGAANMTRERAASLPIQQSANRVRDETLNRSRAEGYVVPPSEVNPTFLGNRLESIAGKAALKQDAALRNQTVTNTIAARELGLPAGTAIDETVLNNYRNSVSKPYNEIAAMSPLAANALRRLRDTRADAKLEWADYTRNAHPQAYRNATALDQRATMLENAIERIAQRQGNPALVDDLRNARTQIAKSYDIERALNLGDAGVSARTIGRSLDKGTPLTGGLETIGRFAQGPGRMFTAEGSAIPAPGVSAMEPMAMAGLALGGSATMGKLGWLAAGLPMIRGPVRSLLLSNPYQNIFATPPSYQPGMATRALSRIPAASPQEQALMSLLRGNAETQDQQ